VTAEGKRSIQKMVSTIPKTRKHILANAPKYMMAAQPLLETKLPMTIQLVLVKQEEM